ncbi:MAG: sensor domain-containing diguanylate cyclase [Lachnospiraceae bacterium]|nr:sensor domain-containing diguanylate cyclase [Lachnospiraceae bacterium]
MEKEKRVLKATKSEEEKKFGRLKRSIIMGYALIVMIGAAAISFVCIHLSQKAFQKEVGDLVSELSIQMSINLDSYLENMENFNTLVFSEKTNYTYDATNNNLDEYTALETEKAIKNSLYSLCIMDNYVDYFIVYSNEHTVGKYSNGTRDLFGGKIYENAKEYASNPRTQDGWFTGFQGDYKRIYYVKRVNENALLVTSIYTSELSSNFEHAGNFPEMKIRVTDSDDTILYSATKEEIGTKLQADLLTIMDGKENANFISDEYLIAVTTGMNDWHVICTLPSSALGKEMQRIAMATITIAILAVVVCILFSVLFVMKMTNPMQNIVEDLDKKASIDALTGIYNKKTFEEKVAKRIASLQDGKLIFILFDVDNFKGVNDNLGHAYGDKVLSDVGKIMRAKFREKDVLGRLGGDEFAVLLHLSSFSEIPLEEFINERCSALCSDFRNYYTGDQKDYKISISMGVSIYGEHGADFDSLYKSADRALYGAKQAGKDTYRLYKRNDGSAEGGAKS